MQLVGCLAGASLPFNERQVGGGPWVVSALFIKRLLSKRRVVQRKPMFGRQGPGAMSAGASTAWGARGLT